MEAHGIIGNRNETTKDDEADMDSLIIIDNNMDVILKVRTDKMAICHITRVVFSRSANVVDTLARAVVVTAKALKEGTNGSHVENSEVLISDVAIDTTVDIGGMKAAI